MPLRRREDAECILGHLFSDFAGIVQQGNDIFWNEYGSRAHIHELWTKRSIIRDEIVHILTAFTETVNGASWRRQGNATYFDYYDEFVIKINKLDDFLHPNVNGSHESHAYFTQQPDLFHDHIDDHAHPSTKTLYLEPTTIFLGYVPTENDPRNPQSYLVCFNDRGALEWEIPLKSGGVPPAVETVPSPEGDEPPRVRIIAAKRAAS